MYVVAQHQHAGARSVTGILRCNANRIIVYGDVGQVLFEQRFLIVIVLYTPSYHGTADYNIQQA